MTLGKTIKKKNAEAAGSNSNENDVKETKDLCLQKEVLTHDWNHVIRIFNLDRNITEAQIKKYFANFQDVIVQTNTDGVSLGRAYIFFKSVKPLKTALGKDKKIDGKSFSMEKLTPSSSIVVENLPSKYSKESTLKKFKCKKVTFFGHRRHKKIAVLLYDNVEDAKKAFDTHNQHIIAQYRTCMDFSNPLSSRFISQAVLNNTTPSRELFVGNLSTDTTEEDLQKMFPSASEVRIPGVDNTVQCFPRYGFVTFPSIADAKSHVKAKKPFSLDDHQLFINYSTSKNIDEQIAVGTKSKGKRRMSGEVEDAPVDKKKKMSSSSEIPSNENGIQHNNDFISGSAIDPNGQTQRQAIELFIGNLSPYTTSASLRKVFPGALSIRLPGEGIKRAGGYCYVRFASHSEALTAQESQKGKQIDGSDVTIQLTLTNIIKEDRGKSVDDNPPSRILKISNISFKTTRETLEKLLPTAKRVIIPKSPNGLIKGFGIAEFKDIDTATKAKESLDKQKVDKKCLHVYFEEQKPHKNNTEKNKKRKPKKKRTKKQ